MQPQLTGRKVFVLFALFFGTVIAVNLTMALFANGTFGGLVVTNSYVASQKFNGWLEDARQGEALGWDIAHRREAGSFYIEISANGAPLAADMALATARRPVGTEVAVPLDFEPLGPGLWRAALPDGRWQVRATISNGRAERRVQFDVR